MASPVAVPADTHVGLDTYTLLTEAFVQGSRLAQVLSFFDPTGGLPVSPAVNDRYISSATANGWTIDTIQYWNGEEWIQVDPTEGELTYVVAGPTFPATAILWNGAAWSAFGGGSGDVLGPGASTANAIVRWSDATGTLVSNSTVLVTGTGDVQLPSGGCIEVNSLVTACRDANGNLILGDTNLAGITAGTTNTAVGDGVGAAVTTGTGNILMGTGTDVTAGADTDAIGIGTGVTTNTGSVVVGGGSSAASPGTTVLGPGASVAAASAGSTVIGTGSSSVGANGVAMGNGATAGAGADSVAIGSGSTASGIQSLALGNGTTASATSSTAIGDGATATVANTIVLGTTAEAVTVPGSFEMPTTGQPVGTTNVLNVTNVPGPPTNLTVNTGSLAYDTVGQDLYVFNGAAWDNFSPIAIPTSESISIAGAGNDPSLGVVTTFVTTTAAASGTLIDAPAASVGQIKYIVIDGYAGDYTMAITSGVDANGNPIATITYTSEGQGSTLTWNGTDWYILNAGGVVA